MAKKLAPARDRLRQAKKKRAEQIVNLPGVVVQTSLLAKLGSIAVHAEEFLSPDGHEVDLTEIKQLLCDPEVVEWMKAMGPLLPVKRRRR